MDDKAPVQNCQLNDGGVCTSCNALSLDLELVQCGICKLKFHAVCSSSSGNDKWATKSMIATFKSSSTKNNFMFLCDCCLTTLETNMADIDGQRIRKMERNMDVICKELLEIKKLLKPTPAGAPEAQRKPQPSIKPDNVWLNPEKLATVKAKPAEALLVVKKDENPEAEKSNMKMIETAVINKRIPVNKSFKDRKGDLVVVCKTTEARDELKKQVSALNNNIEMKTPREKRPTISIVGLNENYKNEEVVDMLVQQNTFMNQFSESNNIADHINVFAVKPLRDKPNVYQAFARISVVLREGFKSFNNKITLGLSTCKIYDQYHVKRCNNCQDLGHYFKNCPNQDVHICAKCGLNHSTRECTSSTRKCVNCTKRTLPEGECNHSADDQACPTIRKAQDDMKKHLNMHS